MKPRSPQQDLIDLASRRGEVLEQPGRTPDQKARDALTVILDDMQTATVADALTHLGILPDSATGGK